MFRIMYDGIFSGNPPSGAPLYAGYDDGNWPDASALAARFPNAVIVRVTVSASDNEGTVLDVENGDATPAQAVTWTVRRRASGADPTVYCNEGTWAAVRSAFQAAGVAEPHYWIAKYDNDPTIMPGAVAKQYASNSGYDTSSVAPYWPGVDSTSTPPTSQENTMAYLISVTPDPTNASNKGAGIFSVDGGTVAHVPDVSDYTNLTARFGTAIVTSTARYQQLIAAQPGAVQVNATALAAAIVPLLPAVPTVEAIASAVLKAQSAAEASG
jgi:hypothetical protein